MPARIGGRELGRRLDLGPEATRRTIQIVGGHEKVKKSEHVAGFAAERDVGVGILGS
jgi:hypothetical protein